jgi:hypothetical protein
VAGARAVEQPEAQHHAVPPGRGEPGGLLLGGQRGADDDRDVLAYAHLLQRLDSRGQMEHRVHAAHRRAHGGRIERVEFGPARGAHLVPPTLGQRQERSSENTGPSGYEQTHRLASSLCPPLWRLLR